MITLHLDDAVIGSLSEKELDILKYVYGNSQPVLTMSIHELARQVSYSTATILRLCKKLGYSGFAEFKYSLRQELNKPQPTAKTLGKGNLHTRMIIDSLIFNAESTAKLMQKEQLLQTFRYFDSNCPIYLWVPGGISSILVDYLEKLLLSAGRQNVYKIEESQAEEHILQNIHTESILILISATGNYLPTIKLAKLARMNGIPIISITPCTNNQIAEFATINFRFFANSRENMGVEFTSWLPIFTVIHLIISAYLHPNALEEKHAPDL